MFSRAEKIFLVAFLLVFTVGDLGTTYIGLSQGLTEINPFFAWLSLDNFMIAVLAKFIGAAIIVWLLIIEKKRKPEPNSTLWMISAILFIYLVVFFFNLFGILGVDVSGW